MGRDSLFVIANPEREKQDAAISAFSEQSEGIFYAPAMTNGKKRGIIIRVINI